MDGTYEGDFKDGVKNGRGIFIEDDQIFEGICINGNFITKIENS